MRRSRSDRLLGRAGRAAAGLATAALATSALALAGAPRPLAAQTVADGAIFLLLPIGARAVGTGGAVAAAGEGSESVWWNPATVARDTLREVAIHHAQTVAGTSTALILVVPWRRIGVVGVAANLFDLFEQDVTPPEGGPPIGTFLPRNIVASVTYARDIGRRVDVGLTYKLVQVRLDCTGQCASVPVDASTTSAVDAGVRVSLAGWLPVSVGAALRNAGPSLELPDRTERERLPTRWQAGLLYEVPGLERYTPDLTVRLSGDVISPLERLEPGLRIGGEATWQERVILRGGYVLNEGGNQSADAAGPTVGLGLVAGRLSVDIAREFQGLSVDAGQPPTYVTLRYRF